VSDVQIKCRHCGHEMMVSEFADVELLTCKCGQKLELAPPTKPQLKTPTVVRRKLEA